MTRVCLIGDPDCNLQYELLSRETSRDALATYDLRRPFENSIAVRTVSIGAAVSLLNDLDWYLTRFVDEALVQEPSISDEEWLSRSLARALRNGEIDPGETDAFCKIYGLERLEEPATPSGESDESVATDGRETTAEDEAIASESHVPSRSSRRLVEPLYVRRVDGDLPEYDLRDVEETLVVRLTEAEYSP
ncbi:hypothetical protein EA462_04340 [Natrarchaeobius halalkaliphilus]|uniref:Uncharacterized protein n=1 Tax=Natrarchaeobius halalkaliphilus TaxID=1679091 RepID=A0A3N6MC12_9EURY|nr:DUF5804 family protein [Natrarchaeobius halalkaliphilus]RQG91226.1 hypothetical protein EA462_04340 [Natrarchaeobius halalkaliphilus]